MQSIHGIGLGPAYSKKTGKEITSVYLMSSMNSLDICERHLKFCSSLQTTKWFKRLI